ncbi:PspC domain-containing protein, partial [Cellulomonas endophytica]|uniref:PspC domain-containing protein n=1 Tax=Cellulomonas endophytica TaxID=2494735 RepID=UPI00196B4A43
MDTTSPSGPRAGDPAGPAGEAATTPLPALGPAPSGGGDDPVGARPGADAPPFGAGPPGAGASWTGPSWTGPSSTGPSSTGPGASAPPRPSGFFASLRRTGVARSEERWVGGVAGGLAERFAIDPLLVRGLLAVSVLLGGLGLVAYGLAWLLLPERRDGRIHLEELVRGRFDMAVVGGILLVLVGLGRGDRWWIRGGDADVLVSLGWIAFLGVVAWVVIAAARRPGGVPPRPGPSGPFGPFP